MDYIYTIPRLANMLNQGRPARSLQTLHRVGGCGEVVSLATFLRSPYNNANLNGGIVGRCGDRGHHRPDPDFFRDWFNRPLQAELFVYAAGSFNMNASPDGLPQIVISAFSTADW
jgi:hypothetical protein